MTKSSDSNKKPSERVLVTIPGYHIPEHVKVWLTRHRITRFYDNPRQCSQCLRFGHGIKSCRGLVRCSKCSENHIREQCQSALTKCALCSNSHEPSSKDCPKYIEKGKILKYSADHHVSLVEARQAVANKTTYAKMVGTQVTSPAKEDFLKVITPIITALQASFESALKQQAEYFERILSGLDQKYESTFNKLQEKLDLKLIEISECTKDKHIGKRALEPDSVLDLDVPITEIELVRSKGKKPYSKPVSLTREACIQSKHDLSKPKKS
ncbi:hypothetical protein X975_19503, partial [Stegodyphus mimosarum]